LFRASYEEYRSDDTNFPVIPVKSEGSRRQFTYIPVWIGSGEVEGYQYAVPVIIAKMVELREKWMNAK